MLSFSYFLLILFHSQGQSKTLPVVKIKPLVLQWEVSHPRNTDQISLIFRRNMVELITNTSSYQKGKPVRLGRFQSPINPELERIKKQIKRYRIQLKQTVSMLSLIKDSRVSLPTTDPHAPVLRINEKEIHGEHPYFKPLASIIYQIWENKWICVECATYKKRRKSIIRTVKKLKSPSDSSKKIKKAKSQSKRSKWDTTKQKFSKKFFRCVPKGKKKIECVDPHFGIFEI